jgi:hypothetical protein
MSNLVFVSGDFCSGSTLLFTLFRKTGRYYCLYEPLHEKLPEYLLWPPLPDDYDHHFFVDNYYSEMKGFDKIPALLNPSWGNSGLYLAPDADADDLYRYFNYLVGTAFGRSERVMLKENRLAFRLGWLRARFPHARIVHIHRKKEDQWKSNVRRVQAYKGKEDVGQDKVTYNGFNVATYCEELKSTFPELDARHFKTGYERFCKLWELSFAEHQKYADISIDYWALTHDFEATSERLWKCLGVTGIDTAALKQFVVPSEKQKELAKGPPGLGERLRLLIDRAGRRYARARLRAQGLFVRES